MLITLKNEVPLESGYTLTYQYPYLPAKIPNPIPITHTM